MMIKFKSINSRRKVQLKKLNLDGGIFKVKSRRNSKQTYMLNLLTNSKLSISLHHITTISLHSNFSVTLNSEGERIQLTDLQN